MRSHDARLVHELGRNQHDGRSRTIMEGMRGFWILITLFAAACGSSTPPPPSTGTGGGVESITGRERIGWDQPATDTVELATFGYAIYVDNARNELTDTSCASAAGTAGVRVQRETAVDVERRSQAGAGDLQHREHGLRRKYFARVRFKSTCQPR